MKHTIFIIAPGSITQQITLLLLLLLLLLLVCPSNLAI
jgi:hypothetical protein